MRMAGEGESLREVSQRGEGREWGGGGGEWGSPTWTVRILCGCCPFARLERRGVYLASTRSSRPPLSERAVGSVDVTAPPSLASTPSRSLAALLSPPRPTHGTGQKGGGGPQRIKFSTVVVKYIPLGEHSLSPPFLSPPPAPSGPRQPWLPPGGVGRVSRRRCG